LENAGFLRQKLELAKAECGRNNFAEARSICIGLLEEFPDDKRLNFVLGFVYKNLKHYDEALDFFEKTITLDPKHEIAYLASAEVYKQLGKLPAAMEQLCRAVQYSVETPAIYQGLGLLYKEQGNLDEAALSFQKAIDIQPDYKDALWSLGILHLHNGNKAGVNKYMRMLLECDPQYFRAYYILARAHEPSELEDIKEKMEELYTNPDTPDEGRMYLGYGLGKVYEEGGNYDKAFECLKLANTIKRASFDFTTDTSIREFDNLISLYTKSSIDQMGPTGFHDKTPIFIVGMPRSGTSLIEQIVSSHPLVYGAGELQLLHQLRSKHGERGVLSADAYLALGEEYIQQIRKINQVSRHIIDKEPANYRYIPVIRLALPDAKIIHCVRDPMDTCFSNYKTYFHAGRPMSNDLVEMGQNYKLYRELMDHYHSLFPGQIYDVIYEKLVQNPEMEIRKILEFCEIPWSDSCLDHHNNARAVQTMSAAQVRRPMYKSSLQTWKNYEKYLEPLQTILEGERPVAQNKKTLNFDGREYDIDALPDAARAQVNNLRVAEAEIKRLNAQLAITQTAVSAYKQALKRELSDNTTQ
jgi:tetratricopeptide (TPR) repeat protein